MPAPDTRTLHDEPAEGHRDHEPSPRKHVTPSLTTEGAELSLSPLRVASLDDGRMEHLWSRAVATDGNQWQMGWPRERLKRAKTVVVGCDQLPPGPHGKEGVDGSSPSEGFAEMPANQAVGLSGL
jgi:hypothetical protein